MLIRKEIEKLSMSLRMEKEEEPISMLFQEICTKNEFVMSQRVVCEEITSLNWKGVMNEEEIENMRIFNLVWEERNDNDHACLHDNESYAQEGEGHGYILLACKGTSKQVHKSRNPSNYVLLTNKWRTRQCAESPKDELMYQEGTELKESTKDIVWCLADKPMVIKIRNHVSENIEKKGEEVKVFKFLYGLTKKSSQEFSVCCSPRTNKIVMNQGNMKEENGGGIKDVTRRWSYETETSHNDLVLFTDQIYVKLLFLFSKRCLMQIKKNYKECSVSCKEQGNNLHIITVFGDNCFGSSNQKTEFRESLDSKFNNEEVKRRVSFRMIVSVNCFVTGNDKEIIDEFKAGMISKFEMINPSELKHCHGITVKRAKKGKMIKQENYVLRVMKEVRSDICNSTQELMGSKESKAQDKSQVDTTMYRRRIGSLRYLVISLTVLNRYMKDFKESSYLTEFMTAIEAAKQTCWIQDLISNITRKTCEKAMICSDTKSAKKKYTRNTESHEQKETIRCSDNNQNVYAINRRNITDHVIYTGETSFTWCGQKKSLKGLFSYKDEEQCEDILTKEIAGLKARRIDKRYEQETLNYDLRYKKRGTKRSIRYSNSSQNVDADNGRSTTDRFFYFGETSFVWCYQKVNLTFLFSYEVEDQSDETLKVSVRLELKRMMNLIDDASKNRLELKGDNVG